MFTDIKDNTGQLNQNEQYGKDILIGEIYDLKSSPYDKSIFACSYLQYVDDKSILSILKMPESIFEDNMDNEKEENININKANTS